MASSMGWAPNPWRRWRRLVEYAKEEQIVNRNGFRPESGCVYVVFCG